MIRKIWDVNPSVGGPIVRNKVWFNYTFRNLGSTKTKTGAYFDKNPSQFVTAYFNTRASRCHAHLLSSVYHDNQRKYRNHWGIAATIPPEAAGVQVTPTSFAHVSKWTRTHTNKLLLEAGFGMYDQEYTELYQPSVTGTDKKVWDDQSIINSRVYNVVDTSNNTQANAWPNPADHFSVLRTYMGAASYIVGAHSLRAGLTWTNGDWKLLTRWTGDVQPINYNAGNPLSVHAALAVGSRNNGVDRELGLTSRTRSMGLASAERGWASPFIGETRESSGAGQCREGGGATFGECPRHG